MENMGRQIILEVGAEGGKVTLYGIWSVQGWQFSRRSIDHSSGETAEELESEIVDSWEEALKLLSAYPWQRLYPLHVHPDFREQVLKSVQAACRPNDARPSRFSEWKALCGNLDG